MPRSLLARLVLVGTATIATALMSSAPVMADASNWKVGYYTPSLVGTLSFAQAKPGGGDSIATFNFTNQPNTALLVTTHGAYKGSTLGDLTGKTISASFHISDARSAFTYYGQPDGCGTPASTRLFFQTDNGGGFAYTHYWWSNPASKVLANGPGTLVVNLDPAMWSDWNGQVGTTDPNGFAGAVANVTVIGFSFGGGCFFENGVGTTDGSGTFTLDTFTVS
jgi:hypothetical protein